MTQHYKDAILDRLADKVNVAQFASFDPALTCRFSRVSSLPANLSFETPGAAASAIIENSPERSVNVRSFDPQSPKSRDFIYGLKDASAVDAAVKQLAAKGLYTIVNETIDISDGGVSGVALGDVLEFAPEDTPRSVEKPGAVSLPRALGISMLATVYGFAPAIDYPADVRVEFSIHPLRRGFRQDHTIIWELEDVGHSDAKAQIRWPNRFSQFIGDKAFGLLVAHLLRLPVPSTTVISRAIAPFRFGRETGSAEKWIRTCPRVQVPGKYTTRRGWTDPFLLMADEDPSGENISSVLSQNGVNAEFSGALLASVDAATKEKVELTIEGTAGFGDEFMIGQKARGNLPPRVRNSVRSLYRRASALLGPVRFEWVYDGQRAWIVQFHIGSAPSRGLTIFPGEPAQFHRFVVTDGLESLRVLIDSVRETGEGIELVGDVGITSHFGDVLRRAKVPSRIQLT